MINIPISYGEFLDKVSILQIKTEFIKDKEKNKLAKQEYTTLSEKYNEQVETHLILKLNTLYESLLEVNKELWKIEDDIRIKEKQKEFDNHFIGLARSVYITNDKRFVIKQKINNLMGSEINEVKSYEDYSNTD
jgi:hypothetical protein